MADRFSEKTSFHNVKIQGELTSADANAAKNYPDKLAKIIQEGRDTPDQIFDADETTLFWKQMPKRTFMPKS